MWATQADGLLCIHRPPPTVLNFFKPISNGHAKQPAAAKRQVCQAAHSLLKKPKLTAQTTVTGKQQPPQFAVDAVVSSDKDKKPAVISDHQPKMQTAADVHAIAQMHSHAASQASSNSGLADPAARQAAQAANAQPAYSNGSHPSAAPAVTVRRYKGVPYAPDAASTSFLTNMGFSSDQAVRALKVTQGNVERAANWLLSGM